MTQIILLVGGILVGALFSWMVAGRNKVALKDQIRNLDLDLVGKNVLLTEMEGRLKIQRESFEEKLAIVGETKELMKVTFQNLATQIMEERTQALSSKNRDNIDTILSPLREQLSDFRKRVDDVYDKESQGRAALTNEIAHLKSLNIKISEDASNLTKALKGDSKVQGDWGQIILERVLEMAGLEKGREYRVQVNSHDAEGNRYLPDAIVYLPSNRSVIIDSKVSLTAFERYCSAENDAERQSSLKSHLLSIRKHIEELAEKDYEDLEEIRSTDCVLMFVPTEHAYLVAIREDVSIFEVAFKKNIVLVCPSTLLSTLKIIAYFWRVEKQQRLTKEISEKANDLYDKFCLFAGSFMEIGESIRRAQEKYDLSLKSLSTGRGNLIRRAEDLKKLGISGKKELPQKLLEQSNEDLPIEETLSSDCEGEFQNGGTK